MKHSLKHVITAILAFSLLFSLDAGIAMGASNSPAKIQITTPKAAVYEMNKGSKLQFKVTATPKSASKSVSWTSSNSKIAVVSSKGIVTAKALGIVKITAKSKSNKKVKSVKSVKIMTPINSVSITGTALVGGKLTANVFPSDSKGTYQWYHVKSGKRTAISGQTGKTYTPVATDAGKSVQVGMKGSGYYKGTCYSKVVTISSELSAIIPKIDQAYVQDIIKNISSKKSNPDLGFKLSGSVAEKEVADYIYSEYKKMGLKNVTMDPVKADGFEFKKGTLKYNDNGTEKELLLGSYQTTFVTNGPKEYQLVYAGSGTKDELKNLDVKGKIVLVDTDQYNDAWINMPAFESKVHGAAAIIACEDSSYDTSYAQYSDDQIQVQDVCGPADAPALSISRNGRDVLKQLMDKSNNQEISITLDVDAQVLKDKGSQNIWAEIPGKTDETIIVMSHYDSYFFAALDDADGTALNMAAAKALIESGYKPDKTIRFIHHGAEEWGISDSNYDWATGAYRQITEVRPEWSSSAFAAINVDSFTIDYNKRTLRINSPQLNNFVQNVFSKNLPEGYSIARLETVANNYFEDFSYMISGIPKMLFTRTDYQSQYDTYHSSADNWDYYCNVSKQDQLISDKVEIIARAIISFDDQLVQPVNYTAYFESLKESIDTNLTGAAANSAQLTLQSIDEILALTKNLDIKIADINEKYCTAVANNDQKTITSLQKQADGTNKQLFALYKSMQKEFTRLNHAGDVVPPHGLYQENVAYLGQGADLINEGNALDAANEISQVDSNGNALDYSKETYDHMAALKSGKKNEKNMSWGTNMIEMPNQNLFQVITDLKEKAEDPTANLDAQLQIVKTAYETQYNYLDSMLKKEAASCIVVKDQINNILQGL